jgi:hypothetical protein
LRFVDNCNRFCFVDDFNLKYLDTNGNEKSRYINRRTMTLKVFLNIDKIHLWLFDFEFILFQFDDCCEILSLSLPLNHVKDLTILSKWNTFANFEDRIVNADWFKELRWLEVPIFDFSRAYVFSHFMLVGISVGENSIIVVDRMYTTH